jgi:hypothetical protein
MDPILTYLNRIPGMLTVQGYVDDTTMAGDTTTGMQWLATLGMFVLDSGRLVSKLTSIIVGKQVASTCMVQFQD